MPSFSGKFRYFETGGTLLQEGPCRLMIEEEFLLLTPQSGAPLSCDLGDIDALLPGDYELTLKLYTGHSISLFYFAKTFQNLCHDLLEAFRKRQLQVLLLEDLEEIERFDGQASYKSATTSFSSKAEIRLYRSNLAILPETATGFSWRYSDIDSVEFDDATYTLGLLSGDDRLVLTKLAKRTRELTQRIRDAVAETAEAGGKIIRSVFPFLNPPQFQQMATLYREGHAVPVQSLCAIHSRSESALLAGCVDTGQKGYVDFLKELSLDGNYFAGFKRLRHEEELEDAPEDAEVAAAAGDSNSALAEEDEKPDAGDDKEAILHWFFFPLKAGKDLDRPANIVAWEATSRTGRATYFFRLVASEQAQVIKDKATARTAIADAVRQLNRAIVMLNFRREPIYLGDDALETRERYHRYAIACRRIPELRRLRGSFQGRAIHTTFEAWQKQVDSILSAHGR